MVDRRGRQRFLIVLGIPTGGTSAVAGVLARLGVDMGDVSAGMRGKPRQGRPYDTWEDADIRSLCLRGAGRPITAEEFVEYVRRRRNTGSRSQREPWGPTRTWPGSSVLGAKHPHLCALARYPSATVRRIFEGVEIVHVSRPLEDSINTDARYFRRSMRAGFLRRIHGQLGNITSLVSPSITVSYNLLTMQPESVVREINRTLALGAREEWIVDAVASVDRRMNHAR